ncbi:hypothetical protein ACO2I3_12540 [Leptospira interrogans]
MPHRVFRLAFLFGLSALLADGAAAQAGKYDFRVVSVAAGDHLNVRERVESQSSISSSKILGQIPANATGVLGSGASLRVGRVRWFEVSYGKSRGWVNGRYLAPLSSQLGSALESNLFCSGTEPFWSLKIEDGKAEMQHAGQDGEQLTVAVREPFQGRGDTLAFRFVNEDGPDLSALVQHKEWCNDGMSDLEYAFEVRIVGARDDDRPLRGCCSLLR